ncbi:class I SAM-dependent RNA methyltransferase [Deferribacteraceae bacterium V6Fe1]|nr:class I SAM-dependent RNA methyltransferase [Deferribacteraceae bacterium V6Fe1]
MQYKNITIHDNAYGGYGVGTLDSGKKVFIPFTVQGDVVDIEITEDKKSFSYGIIKRLVTPSDLRNAEPYCPFLNECGGCLFGNIKYNEQLKIKENILKHNFRDIDNFNIDNVFFANPLRYRIKCSIKLKDGRFGFYKFNTRELINISDCPVISESIIEKVKDIAKGSVGLTELNFIENNEGQVICDIDNIGYTNYTTKFGDLFVSPKVFFQTNRYLIPQLQEIAAGLIPENRNILELYCGNGFFTIALSKKAKSILAVDFDREVIKLAKKSNIDNSKFIAYDLTRPFSPNFQFDSLFVDPSRQGLSKSVIRLIKDKLPKEIVYVSCNPTTMKRDIKNILEYYKIDKFYMFDMFPNTYHIESVAKLVLK